MRSNVEWIYWGKTDPLWAVATHPGRERGGANPWNDADFYETGRQDFEAFSRRWERFGMDLDAVLEIGCGAGRLSKWIARSAGKLHGVDVSAEMIAYAKSKVNEPNAEFHVTDGQRVPLPDGSVTAAFSAHVFQHFESATDSLPVFREIARVLKPGGTLMIHLPLYRHPHAASRATRAVRGLYTLRTKAADTVAAWRRWKLRRGHSAALMRGTHYDIDWLHSTLRELGMDDVEFTFFAPHPGTALDPFVLARKRPETIAN